MGIIGIVLSFFGFAADAISLTEFLSDAIRRGSGLTAQGLFAKCFVFAVNRKRSKLAHFTESRDPRTVTVSTHSLETTLASLDTGFEATSLPAEKQQIIALLTARFRDSVILPGCQLSRADLDREIASLLDEAMNTFYASLPFKHAAFTEVLLAHIREDSKRQQKQADLLEEIHNKVARMVSVQDDLAQRMEYLDPTVLQQESSRPENRNPFRIVKAEDFDHDYHKLASLFREPSDYDNIRSPDNLIIAGGRGCGKSMILRSLSAPAAIEIERLHRTGQGGDNGRMLGFRESGLRYFGVYVKLARGYFYEWTPDCKLTADAATHLFQHVFNLQLLRSMIEMLHECKTRNILTVHETIEHALAERICRAAPFCQNARTFTELVEAILGEEYAVAQYLGELRLGVGTANYRGSHTAIHNFLDTCCRAVLDTIPDLEGCRVYFLLDEYENLAEFQQTTVNTLAKLRPLSMAIKVATRALGVKSIRDLQGEAIQVPRDYHLVLLDYEIGNARYRELLVDIANRRLQSEGFAVPDIVKLLPSPPKYHPSTAEEVEAALEKMLAGDGKPRSSLSEEAWKEYMHQWDRAMVFRLNADARRPYTYGGMNDLVDLSSGIISNFLELCKMAFYLAEGEGVDVRNGEPIPWHIQNEAIYNVSAASVNQIARNIEDRGPAISRLVLDLADIFRAKLHKHPSEPEAARLVITDPGSLENSVFGDVAHVLCDTVRWSVIHDVGPASAYFPKHRADVRSADYLLNRILAPTLRLSPRPRWRTSLRVADLAGLLSDQTRSQKRRALVEKHSRSRREESGPTLLEQSEN